MKREDRGAALLLGVALMLLAFTSACNSAGGSDNNAVTPLELTVEGDYMMSMTWTSDQCTGALTGSSEAGMLRIGQMGDSLSGTLHDDCGDVEDALSGSLNGDTVEFAFTDAEVISPDCTLTTTGIAAGTVSGMGSTGTVVVTLSGTGTDCPKQVPCQVSGSFTLESCPPADCTPNDCGEDTGDRGMHRLFKTD